MKMWGRFVIFIVYLFHGWEGGCKNNNIKGNEEKNEEIDGFSCRTFFVGNAVQTCVFRVFRLVSSQQTFL